MRKRENDPRIKVALDQLPNSIHRINGFVTDGTSVWAVQHADKSVSVTKPTALMQEALIGTLVVIASEPAAPVLRQALAAIPEACVVEDPSSGTPP